MSEQLAPLEIAFARLFAVLWDAFVDGVGIDACDLESLVDCTGLAVWLPATAEDVARFDGLEIEVGDMLLKLTPEGRRLVTEGRRLIREAPKPE